MIVEHVIRRLGAHVMLIALLTYVPPALHLV